MHHRVPALLLALAAFTALGCGGASLDHTINRSKLKDMSRHGQLWVYDAENGIVVALDRLDDARDDLYRIQGALKRARRRAKAAEKRRNSQGVSVAEAFEGYLEALEDWAEDNIRLMRLGLVVARASVELAKAQVIQREDLLGGKDVTLKKFEDQYQRLKQRFEARQKQLRTARNAARKKERRWRNLRRGYVAQTGDHDSGLWID